MGSAPRPLCLLMIISTSTTLFFQSQLMGAAWDLRKTHERGTDRGTGATHTGFLDNGRDLVEKVSGEENVGGELLTKIRVLLGLKPSNLGGSTHGIELRTHQVSPAPAPIKEKALIQAPVPPFHTHIYSRSPPPHKTHIPHARDLEASRDGAKEASTRRIVTAVVVSIGTIIIIFGGIMVLVCKRSRRNRKKRSHRTMPVSGRSSKVQIPATNKVSFDPGPDPFYLNSLATYLEIDSSLKQPSEAKHASSNENILSSRSQTGELMKRKRDDVSCLDEEIYPIESLSLSSNDESFHSVCNSHSSIGLVSVVSEENLSHPSGNCSPFNSSYRSTSPDQRLAPYTSTKSPIPSTSLNSMSSIPLNLKHPCSSSQRLECKASEATFLSQCSSQSLFPLRTLKMHQSSPSNDHSPKLQMTSLAQCSPSTKSKTLIPMAEAPSVPSNVESSLIPKNDTKASIASPHPGTSVAISNIDKSTQSPSMPLVRKANIPKPPPPPLPPLKPPSLQKVFNSSHPPPPPPPPLPPLKPPSLQKVLNSSLPPPPPPCPLQQSSPVGKDGSPLPKLKPLHWDKVRAAPDHSMVWDKIRSSSFELDEEMIESLFGYNIQSSTKNEEVKSKSSSSPNKLVLDHKRLQNITILLKALNSTSEQVCDALMQGRGVSVPQLEALVRMVPTKEEEEKLSKYKGDISELDPSEQFIKAILRIPFAFSRIEVMLYKETFEDEVAHLRKSFAMLEEACKELRSSRLFLKLLEAVLKTGNRMNVGTIRGGARAFKLDALLKLADVKGTDGKTTLLHFVVQEMIRSEGVSAMEKSIQMRGNLKNKLNTAEEREDDIRLMGIDLVSGLSNELSNVKKTASIDLDVLVTSVSNLSSGMGQLKHLIEVDLCSDDMNESFVLSMKCFLNHAQRIIRKLKDDEDQVLLHVGEITEYYHGNVSKEEANPLRIFVVVRDFLGMLDRVCKEVKSLKIHLGPNPVIPFH